MYKRATFGERLVAFACVEGILFSGPFAIIFYFKTRGLLPGLCKSNEFIARDEAQHMRFACFLFKDRLLPSQRPSTERVYEIVRSCVDAERVFVKAAVLGMPGLSEASNNRNKSKDVPPPHTHANDQCNRTTPSYVAFTDTERLIGDAANGSTIIVPRGSPMPRPRARSRGAGAHGWWCLL